MQLGRGTRIAMRIASFAILAFIYIPIGIIVLYSFNESRVATWPISGLTLDWYRQAFADPGIRNALSASVEAAIGATIVALALGTLIALAVQRYKFFGRETISFLVILPLALPGIVTGMALNTTFRTLGVDLGLFTVIVGHATFCIVVVYNNAVARMRRVSGSLDEASTDLGADSWQTFRYVTAPQISTAIIAASLLAFALSFDEVIVTTFTISGQETLPIWILANLSRPNQLPIVNVVAVFVILLSIIPVWIAQRLASGAGGAGRI